MQPRLPARDFKIPIKMRFGFSTVGLWTALSMWVNSFHPTTILGNLPSHNALWITVEKGRLDVFYVLRECSSYPIGHRLVSGLGKMPRDWLERSQSQDWR